MLLPLKNEIIYGPVRSRRLGRSLGINILAAGQKVCSFDCVYCQYGWGAPHGTQAVQNFVWPSAEDVKKAVEEALLNLPVSPAFITFSGNGEATLHPGFPELVHEVIGLRDALAPQAKTAILSNSSLIADSRIRAALEKLDTKIMKLDCGCEETFAKYNHPASGIGLDAITSGLTQMPGVTIQALFSTGSSGNLSAKNIQAWIERLITIKPRFVQVYSLDRDAPDKDLRPASKKDLAELRSLVIRAGIPAEFY
ncbi:MAG: radical SAM protein [Candidatus Aminicenantes bacterium]|nr:radical SAM protein [Candidatus Aminicenantes bacterium]